MVLELNNQNFESEVINNDKIVAVYFWAPGCDYCKNTVDPIIEELAEEYKDKGIVFGKMNLSESSETMERFHFWIGDVPALVCFKGNKVVDAIVGPVVKQDLVRILDSVVAKHVQNK